MTLGGWIFMLASVSGVTALCLFCFRRVLATSRTCGEQKPPPAIDPEKQQSVRQ